ncbi:MAG: hypothetical protein J7K65_07280, partial [Planctomycetes bacterium]|nr:hypothetical protein [Planctomycetota bacterium]
ILRFLAVGVVFIDIAEVSSGQGGDTRWNYRNSSTSGMNCLNMLTVMRPCNADVRHQRRDNASEPVR